MAWFSLAIVTKNAEVIVKFAKTRLCGMRTGDALGDTPWKDVEGAFLAEVKSSAYGDLGTRPTRRVS